MSLENLKTLFVDIDGTILFHNNIPNMQTKINPVLLPGVLEKFAEWNMKGYYIVLVTGRRESERPATIKQLEDLGIVYDLLITGIGRGQRVLINDIKPDSMELTARAINVTRNEGISGIEI